MALLDITMRSAEFQRDYAYYTRTLAEGQRCEDETAMWLGVTRVDLAYAKSSDREAIRLHLASNPNWDADKARFIESRARSRFEAALNAGT